eukprot:747179-Hanusia_phi.AAC.4
MSSTMSSPKNPISIGCKVTVKGKSKGVVRYIGPTKFGAGIWVGVELDKPKGQHDGSYDGQRYFTCKPMHGVYAIAADVQPLKPWQSAVRVIQGLVRGKAEKQVTDHKKTFLAWNALELDEEAQHHEQVCVLHGGIPRVEGLTLNRVNAIVRRRQCPKIVQTIDDAILFDLMWADPQEAKGIAMAAQRGPNCRKFGPDITKRFLADNSLSLCIRSHEVPISLRGFEERHEGRLLTVFSASNYCGQAGNYGAIVVFDDEMSYTLEEHMAPDLDAMILEYNKTTTIPPIAPNPLIQRKNSERDRPQSLAQSRELMNHEVISKLEVKICQYKDELWWYWKRIDENGSGMIPAAKWREGMTNTLKLEIPWFSLQNELARPNQNGEVDYRDFLNRIRNKAIMTGLKKVDNSWEKQILVTLYESILMADLTLKQTLAEFDPDGDGVVSPWEFKQALQKAKVDIPDGQLTALMCLIEKDGGKLDVGTFLDRFQLVYSRAADEGLENTNVGSGERARDLLTRVGRHLLQNRS